MQEPTDPQAIVKAVAAAQEPDGPFHPAMLATYLWVLLVSILGGVVSFVRKVKEGSARRFNFVELLGEVITAALVGLITFWLCESAGVNKYLEAALIAVTSHMGTRALFKFEKMLDRKFPDLRDEPKE